MWYVLSSCSQVAGTAAWSLAAQWLRPEGTSPSSAPGWAETPVKAVWRRVTCCPARRCRSTAWTYSDSVLSVGLTERLFLSTDRSQFRELLVHRTRCLFCSFVVCCEHTGSHGYRMFKSVLVTLWLYLCIFLLNVSYTFCGFIDGSSWVKVFVNHSKPGISIQQYFLYGCHLEQFCKWINKKPLYKCRTSSLTVFLIQKINVDYG